MPLLTTLFPNIQFIVTSHSPFILNSVENVVIYDLENHMLVEHGLNDAPYGGIVEEYLDFRLKDNNVVIRVIKGDDEIYNRTALLITETFTLKNTGMRIYASDERLRLLQKEMNLLYGQLEKLHNSPDSKMVLRTICSLLRRESAFAAFKRCYVRVHSKEYPQLQKYL